MPNTPMENVIEAHIREHVASRAGVGKWVCRGCGKQYRLGIKCVGQTCRGSGMDGVLWIEVGIVENIDVSEP